MSVIQSLSSPMKLSYRPRLETSDERTFQASIRTSPSRSTP